MDAKTNGKYRAKVYARSDALKEINRIRSYYLKYKVISSMDVRTLNNMFKNIDELSSIEVTPEIIKDIEQYSIILDILEK